MMIATGRLTKTAAAAYLAGIPGEDRFIREDECFRLSGLSRTTRWRLERSGKFPRRRQISDNAVAWLLSEVMNWRATRPPTAQAESSLVAAS